MSSNYESFFTGSCFAVIGNSSTGNFPGLTYNGLKKMGKKVYPIDPSASQIEGDNTYKSFEALPEKVDRVILELPKNEIVDWFMKAVDAGVKDIWIHMGCEAPGILAIAEKQNINLRTGTCAVMYVTPGFSYHSIHKCIMKLLNKY